MFPPRVLVYLCVFVFACLCSCVFVRVLRVCIFLCECFFGGNVLDFIPECACVYSCTRLRVRAHMCVRLFVCLCVCVGAWWRCAREYFLCSWVYLCMCMCIGVHVCFCKFVCVIVFVLKICARIFLVCACVCVCLCVYMCVCVS